MMLGIIFLIPTLFILWLDCHCNYERKRLNRCFLASRYLLLPSGGYTRTKILSERRLCSRSLLTTLSSVRLMTRLRVAGRSCRNITTKSGSSYTWMKPCSPRKLTSPRSTLWSGKIFGLIKPTFQSKLWHSLVSSLWIRVSSTIGCLISLWMLKSSFSF